MTTANERTLANALRESVDAMTPDAHLRPLKLPRGALTAACAFLGALTALAFLVGFAVAVWP